MEDIGAVSLTRDNAAYLEMFGKAAPENQEIRELTQNSIDALVRCGKKHGRIAWFPVIYNRIMKLAIADNGESMTEKEVRDYLVNIGSGIGDKSNVKSPNFGTGSKCTTLPRNPRGVIYICKPPNLKRHITVFHKKENQYIGSSMEEGELMRMCPDLKNSKGWEVIEDCEQGTMVLLLGENDEHNTGNWPTEKGGEGKKNHWITEYLNKKYNYIPENIDITIYPPNATSYRSAQRVLGQQKLFLDIKDKGYSVKKGTWKGTKGLIHWNILNKVKHDSHGTSLDIGGNFTIRLGNENYQVFDRNNGGYDMLRRHGIGYGADHVMLHLEIEGATANFTRSGLEKNGHPINIYDMAQEFQTSMPSEIREFLKERQEASQKCSKYNKESKMGARIASILTIFGNCYKLPRFLVKRSGDVMEVIRKHKVYSADENKDNETEEGDGEPRKSKSTELKGTPSINGGRNVGGYRPPAVVYVTENEYKSIANCVCLFDKPSEQLAGTFYFNQESMQFVGDLVPKIQETLSLEGLEKITQEEIRAALKDHLTEKCFEIYTHAHLDNKIDDYLGNKEQLSNTFVMQRMTFYELTCETCRRKALAGRHPIERIV